MDKPAFFAAVAEILEADPAGLTGDEKISDVGNWDSLSVISFIAMVDSDLGKVVDGRDQELVMLETAAFDPLWTEFGGAREGRCAVPCFRRSAKPTRRLGVIRRH